MVYGYLRVSTIDQDNEKFKTEILKYANDKNLGQVKFTEEKISGKKTYTERELGKLIEQAGKGDLIIVPELSRLSRSIPEIYKIISHITGKGIRLHILKQNLFFEADKQDLTSKVVLNTFAMLAELEADLISMRTKEALKAKKAQGVKLGRKPGTGLKLAGKEKEILEYLKLGMRISQIARVMKCDRLTLAAFIKSQGLNGSHSLEDFKSAFKTLKQASKMPFVSLYAMRKAVKCTRGVFKRLVVEHSRAGNCVLSKGDWSLSTKEERKEAIDINGQEMLLIKYNIE